MKTNSQQAKSFILVHGAWSGPYAWQYIEPGLNKNGHKVIAVQLPGHGSDTTDPASITLDTYIRYVAEVIQELEEKVILVGHSMAGMIISGVAELIPEKIEKLVYVTAYVPLSGQSAYVISSTDKQSLLGASLIVSEDQFRFDIKRDEIVNILCQDGSESVKKLLLENYKVEPGVPFSNPVTLTDTRFGSVVKLFIETLQDHGIGNELQKEMIKSANITRVYQLNTGHSPFLSKPEELLAILTGIAESN